MAKIHDSILELIGHTPLVRLHRVEAAYGLPAQIIGKLEYFNPAGSSKDRIALEMVESAERSGRLKPGGTIVEGTSGNTGIALAAVAAAKGYKAILVMPDNLSLERTRLLKGFGAEVAFTPGALNMPGAGAKAAEITAATENAFLAGQGGNPDNPSAHRKTTGPEIWEDTDGKVDIFIAAVGTGGTITGAGEYLRSQKPDIEIIGVEPEGCPLLSKGYAGPHKIQGIGGGILPPVLNQQIYNEIIAVTDEDAYELARVLTRTEGIPAGISAGAALWAAIQVAKRPENSEKNIVVILPDSSERYLSGDLYD
ncbi:O-acetylserine sulfhydrylase [bioreactor metagenome]|uniref:cysteine synthase n=1 Tax=bioreactor metagenome TaxID=1076179 RepID=A0A645A7P0_9ZZZZ